MMEMEEDCLDGILSILRTFNKRRASATLRGLVAQEATNVVSTARDAAVEEGGQKDAIVEEGKQNPLFYCRSLVLYGRFSKSR